MKTVKLSFANSLFETIVSACRETFPTSWKTSLWFFKLMFPVSLAVTLLNYWDILPYLSSYASPVFEYIGLPGSAALVFITSAVTNVYTVLALLSSFDYTMREMVIVALMCLVSHNYIVETVVLKKTGSSAWWMVTIRILGSFVLAFVLNLILPQMEGALEHVAQVKLTFKETMLGWLSSSAYLAVKVVTIITVLMVFQRLLEKWGVLQRLSMVFTPLMRVMGLPDSCSFLWLVGNTLGLAYGSAVMLDYTAQGKLTQRDSQLLNHHLALSHSLLEDPMLFVAVGCPLAWMLFPRIILAIIVVWTLRLVYWIKDSSFVKRTAVA
ncbi:MAG: nucleoside recognition domain-containing protein [Marinifilaceae bacterium]